MVMKISCIGGASFSRRMSLRLTKGDENAFCGARLQACRVDSRVDVLPFLRSDAKSTRYALFQGSDLPEFFRSLVSMGLDGASIIRACAASA
jgi:hypothetical protein